MSDVKKYCYEEFIQYDKDFKAGCLDFYGPLSPLEPVGQKGFLKEYASYYKNRYGDRLMFEKAVDSKAVSAFADSLSYRADNLDFTAYKRRIESQYKGWSFYTKRVCVKNNSIVLSDGHRFPVPCAKYEFDDFVIKKIKFSVKIGQNYHHDLPGGILSTTTGRCVEFRKGCMEIIKLYFAPDGTFCYKDGAKKIYHYDIQKIGKFDFGRWADIEIVFESDHFALFYKGETHRFNYSASGVPDTLFLGGGMQPVDEWEFKPVSISDVNGNPLSMFRFQDKKRTDDVLIGKVALPSVIGTEKDKDNALVLKSSFAAERGYTYSLHIDALDPGGEVLVNGKCVAAKDSFDPFTVNITDFVHDGKNELEIVVFPRAPEVLFAWHKNRDYYNGWFCLGARLVKARIYSEEPINIVTEKVGAHTDFLVSWDTGITEWRDVSYKMFLSSSYPEEGERIFLDGNELCGGLLEKRLRLPVVLWTPENPHLYKIRIELYKGSTLLCCKEQETGFRTIEQKNGEIYLNDEKIVLKGALSMQFLPPYENIPINHLCPTNEQIAEQAVAVKEMNGNCLRMHQLGYGCGDSRFAYICDRLGVLLIWTTRLIDSAENMLWSEKWYQKSEFQRQITHVINHPSIIMWEGSNELHANLSSIDRIYDAFVAAVKETDRSRLICPVSHLYYGGGIYDNGCCKYYTTDGKHDESGNAVSASYGWRDSSVVRSAHTYCLLLGYGTSWRDMATQNWPSQSELFEETEKAYLITEFAVIGRQNPETDEAKTFINKDSYEIVDEVAALGYNFDDDEWELSQAFQALCASAATKQLRKHGADGMLWCCLWGGANDASYLKPPVDFYGYKKLAFYQLTESFQAITAFNANPDVLFCPGYTIKPLVCGTMVGKEYSLSVEILDYCGNTVDKIKYDSVEHPRDWTPDIKENGYYTVRYVVSESE